MHFIFITTDLSGGGAEKAILKIAHLLIQRGHIASILIFENKIEHTLPNELTVEILGNGFKRSSHGWLGKRLSARKLKKKFNSNNQTYDLIISTLPYADEIVKLAQLPRHYSRIANTLGSEISALEKVNPNKAKRRKRRYQALYGNNAPLVSVSKGVANDLCHTLKRTSIPHIIPNPLNLSSIRALSAQSSKPLHHNPYVIHVGRFSPQKRHDLLLDTWHLLTELPDLILLTAPNHELSNMITARGLQDRVHIAGFQTNPYPWITQARFLVLCSDHEGLPNVLLESLACGTPVISTDCPSGPAEILRDMPECLVPCGDVNALANTLIKFLKTPPTLDRMDFSPYLPDKVASAWEALAHQSSNH